MRLLFWSKGIGLQKEQRVFTLLALLAVQKSGANVAMTIKSSHFQLDTTSCVQWEEPLKVTWIKSPPKISGAFGAISRRFYRFGSQQSHKKICSRSLNLIIKSLVTYSMKILKTNWCQSPDATYTGSPLCPQPHAQPLDSGSAKVR